MKTIGFRTYHGLWQKPWYFGKPGAKVRKAIRRKQLGLSPRGY